MVRGSADYWLGKPVATYLARPRDVAFVTALLSVAFFGVGRESCYGRAVAGESGVRPGERYFRAK